MQHISNRQLVANARKAHGLNHRKNQTIPDHPHTLVDPVRGGSESTPRLFDLALQRKDDDCIAVT